MPQSEDMINPTFIKKIKQTFSSQGPLNWHKLLLLLLLLLLLFIVIYYYLF